MAVKSYNLMRFLSTSPSSLCKTILFVNYEKLSFHFKCAFRVYSGKNNKKKRMRTELLHVEKFFEALTLQQFLYLSSISFNSLSLKLWSLVKMPVHKREKFLYANLKFFMSNKNFFLLARFLVVNLRKKNSYFKLHQHPPQQHHRHH